MRSAGRMPEASACGATAATSSAVCKARTLVLPPVCTLSSALGSHLLSSALGSHLGLAPIHWSNTAGRGRRAWPARSDGGTSAPNQCSGSPRARPSRSGLSAGAPGGSSAQAGGWGPAVAGAAPVLPPCAASGGRAAPRRSSGTASGAPAAPSAPGAPDAAAAAAGGPTPEPASSALQANLVANSATRLL